MKISVITPTWNQAKYIRDTIESVINQTHKDIEYIIIDNNSDDGTKDIVEEYMAADSRIIYVREADHGQAEAINKGLGMATGDIICWINSDDFYADDKVFERVNKCLEQCEDIDVIVGDGWYCNKEKAFTEYNHSNRSKKKWILARWYYIMQPSVFWRKNEFRLDEKYHYVFDWKYFVEMFDAKKVVYIRKPLSVYRMYEDNKTGQDNAKRKKEIYELQKELGRSRLNTAWCKHVYKVYEKAEKKDKPSMKKNADRMSRILFHITGKRICSF